MMNVVDDVLVIEEKGFILSKISNVQTINVLANLHKSLVAELMLTRILKRAKELTVKSDFTLQRTFTVFLAT
jgi:N-acetylglutamate synthase-like GNAT family acetyltransferase